ncbi:MAG: efflux RND transporter periplasmic adaptor subunit [Acidobacteriota bacterium]
MSRNKKIIVGIVILLALGALAFANFKFKRNDGIEVTTEEVRKRHLEALVTASGKIQPRRDVNISADTMGRVTDLAVDEGVRVKKGQFLLQIDPRNLKTAVQRTEASLAAARSNAEQVRLALESARLALKQAQDNYKRQQDLWKGGLTTRETLERAENELKTRQADYASQEQNVRTMQLRMQSEMATAASARFDLSKVRIESPIDGIVTRRNIEEGETVVIGTMNNAGTVLLTIADMSVIQAEVEVDETDIPSLRIGQPGKVTIDAMPGQTFTGKVTEIGNSPILTTGTASQATNFKVIVTLDKEIAEVRPGFTCTAEITTAVRDDVVSVPIQATTVREFVLDEKGDIVRPPDSDRGRKRPATTPSIADLKPGQSRKELEGVFVVENGKARFTALKSGIAGEKYFEVLSGVKPGDMVITGPFASVRELADGAAVKPAAGAGAAAKKP